MSFAETDSRTDTRVVPATSSAPVIDWNQQKTGSGDSGKTSVRQFHCPLLIAAQALRTGVTLVIANLSEFARVTGLVWEDWALAP